MTFPIRAIPLPLRSLAFGSITASYVAVGNPIDRFANLLVLTNSTNEPLLVSADGTNDHFVVLAGGQLTLNISANQCQTSGLYVAALTQFFVKRAAGAPSSGAFYVATIGAA